MDFLYELLHHLTASDALLPESLLHPAYLQYVLLHRLPPVSLLLPQPGQFRCKHRRADVFKVGERVTRMLRDAFQAQFTQA